MALSLFEQLMLHKVQQYALGTQGMVFYVDNSGNPKFDLENAPYSTIALALAQCVANRGDVIIVRRGHAETITAAAGIDVNKAGVTIIGQGRGSSRPTITFGAAAASFDITANDVTIQGLNFAANFADIEEAMNVIGLNCTIRDCRFYEATNLNFLKCIAVQGTSAHDCLIEKCSFEAPDAANTHGIHIVGASQRCVIQDNYMRGDWGTSAIANTAANALHCRILRNFIENLQTGDASDIIDMASGATGVIDGNICSHGNVTAGNHTTAIDAGTMFMGASNRIQDAYGTPPAAEYGDIAGTINADT